METLDIIAQVITRRYRKGLCLDCGAVRVNKEKGIMYCKECSRTRRKNSEKGKGFPTAWFVKGLHDG